MRSRQQTPSCRLTNAAPVQTYFASQEVAALLLLLQLVHRCTDALKAADPQLQVEFKQQLHIPFYNINNLLRCCCCIWPTGALMRSRQQTRSCRLTQWCCLTERSTKTWRCWARWGSDNLWV
jgi:hypothetical protein